MTHPQPKPWIARIHAYKPGRSNADDGRVLVKLSANENPLGTSPAALNALVTSRVEAATYPDPNSKALREKIAKLHSLEASRIVCGTGSDELLNLSAQGFAGPGDEVLFSRRSFSVYEIAARRCGASPIQADDAHYTADVDALLKKVSERTRVVFLANPNNPTGTWIPASEVKRLHAGLPEDVLLVIDEAYAEYLAPEEQEHAFALASQYQNVLVTRTFSKIYGLAAERIGWATGAPAVIDVLNRIRGPFNVTVSGQKAAEAALDDQGFVLASREHNASERARLEKAIAALGNHGLSSVPSWANFLLVEFHGEVSATAALSALAKAGFAVRHMPEPGLDHALRITIGKSDDMDRVIATLRELCGETV